MSQFTFTPFDRDDFLVRGYTSINCNIDGFMEGSISLHVHKISLNLGVSVDIKRWSSAQFSSDSKTHIASERLFAQALLAACDLAEQIESQGQELMEAYERFHAPKPIAV